MIIRITALCLATAMICTALRPLRPELATAISLAGGVAALGLLIGEATQAARWADSLRSLMRSDGDVSAIVLKGAGIAVVSELGSQLCLDAGERALAGRIALASRVAILGLCAPMIAELTALIGGAFSQG